MSSKGKKLKEREWEKLLFDYSSAFEYSSISANYNSAFSYSSDSDSCQDTGMVIVLPCIDIWTRVNLKPQKLLLARKNILTADGGIIEINTEVEYQVADIIHFVTRVQKLEEVFSQLSHQCLVNTASQKTQDDFENKKTVFESSFQEELNKTIVSWGLEITKVQLQSVKVLKAAEPIDALSNLISSLRVAFGFVSEENPVSEFAKLERRNGDTLSEVVAASVEKAVEKGPLKNAKVALEFRVEEEAVYCSVDNGSVEIREARDEVGSDVVVSVSRKDLQDLLSGKISPVDAYRQGKMARYKIVDYTFPTAAELARVILTHKGIEFEDVRLDGARAGEALAASPFRTLPVLEVDGEAVAQNHSICRFLAAEHGLSGKSGRDAAKCDLVMDALWDMFARMRRPEVERMTREQRLAELSTVIEEDAPAYLDGLEALLKKSGTGYFVTDQVTWCDLGAALALTALEHRRPGCLDKYSELQNLVARVVELPAVGQFLLSRAQSDGL
ncbi:uncharacterized protein [Centruroides vittatus]|uniref:uncharacterized protein isoform X2 n=1 Tax=Centruroides vittatus TaxID=120091 RepID=UPI00350EA753